MLVFKIPQASVVPSHTSLFNLDAFSTFSLMLINIILSVLLPKVQYYMLELFKHTDVYRLTEYVDMNWRQIVSQFNDRNLFLIALYTFFFQTSSFSHFHNVLIHDSVEYSGFVQYVMQNQKLTAQVEFTHYSRLNVICWFMIQCIYLYFFIPPLLSYK